MNKTLLAACIGALCLSSTAFGAAKYSVKVSAPKAAVGKAAKAQLAIDVAQGSHVSPDAPLKILLKSDGLELTKAKLGHADAVTGDAPSPRFEIPFVAKKKGAQHNTADATFIVCTQQLCEREHQNIDIPVNVQ